MKLTPGMPVSVPILGRDHWNQTDRIGWHEGRLKAVNGDSALIIFDALVRQVLPDDDMTVVSNWAWVPVRTVVGLA